MSAINQGDALGLVEINNGSDDAEIEKLRYFRSIIPEIVGVDKIPNGRNAERLIFDGN